jgi:phenylpyruvate tautomerase PptA (4-oxalocrotonate tautomerase family)
MYAEMVRYRGVIVKFNMYAGEDPVSQVTIYGHSEHLTRHRTALSDAIHSCVIDALGFPADKRFHRFIRLEREDFIHPADRSERYTIIEISMFEGRAVETKKALIRLLFERLQAKCGLSPQDVEITIFETPRANWGIRGLPGDELGLTYKVEV